MDLKQLERHAYTSGDTREAALLRAVIDLYNLGAADEAQNAVIDRLRHELGVNPHA